jgi:predicted enzyme related to lactoylglutathione lyase
MSSAEAHDTSDGKVDMHLEIDIIPVSNVERTKQFYECVGWRFDPMTPRWMAFASSSSRHRARGARSRSAKDSRRPRLARPRPG